MHHIAIINNKVFEARGFKRDNTKKMSGKIFCVLYVLLLVNFTNGQGCTRLTSTQDPTKMDYHCKCLEKLPKLNTAHTLTINQKGCENNGLHLDWKSLYYVDDLQLMIIDGAQVNFADRTEQRGLAPLFELIFTNCKVTYLPAYAFSSLQVVDTIRFINCSINVIQSQSFANLDTLETIELFETNVTKIERNAFHRLPSINTIAMTKSMIGELQTEAINLRRHVAAHSHHDCLHARSEEGVEKMFGRSLISAKNISLPDDGARLFIYETSIGTLSKSAVSTDIFPYVIVAASKLHTVSAKSFDVLLDNECEISAFLSIENTFERVESGAFSAVSGSHLKKSRAFVVFSGNVFKHVESKGFLLSDSLQIFSVRDNQFACICDNFQWILSNENSDVQKNLERTLVTTSSCEGGQKLDAFLLTGCRKLPTAPAHKTPVPAGSVNVVPSIALVIVTIGIILAQS